MFLGHTSFLCPLLRRQRTILQFPFLSLFSASLPPYIFSLGGGNPDQSMLSMYPNAALHPQAPAPLVFCNADSRKIPGQDGSGSRPMQLLFGRNRAEPGPYPRLATGDIKFPRHWYGDLVGVSVPHCECHSPEYNRSSQVQGWNARQLSCLSQPGLSTHSRTM